MPGLETLVALTVSALTAVGVPASLATTLSWAAVIGGASEKTARRSRRRT